MKNKQVHDERVMMERRRITNEAFTLVMIFLIASILIQQIVFKALFSEYATEFICFFGASFYILVRNIFVGNKLFSDSSSDRKLILTNSLVSGVVITAVTGYQLFTGSATSKNRALTLLVVFAVATVTSFLALYIIFGLNKRKIRKIEKELDDKEDEE